MESSGKGFANERYLREYGIDGTMVTRHELAGLDPPPYDPFSTIMGENLSAAPSPAPIMEQDVVMGDFLDDRIDELEKKLNECNEKLKIYEGDDDEFQDVQEEIPGEVQTLGQPMKKYDYKTKGRLTINNINFATLQRAIENFEGVKVIQLDRDPETFGWLENKIKRDSPYSDSSYFFRQLNSDENLYSKGKINSSTSGVMYIVIFETKEILDDFLKYYFVEPHLNRPYKATPGIGRKLRRDAGRLQQLSNFAKLESEMIKEISEERRKYPLLYKKRPLPPGKRFTQTGMYYDRSDTAHSTRGMINFFKNVFTDLNLESGIPISTVKKLVDGYGSPPAGQRRDKYTFGVRIGFEDENDKREVEAMQGGGYRRRNTSRKSRKRNTSRKSRKRNTRRKSKKRKTRRKTKKK